MLQDQTVTIFLGTKSELKTNLREGLIMLNNNNNYNNNDYYFFLFFFCWGHF